MLYKKTSSGSFTDSLVSNEFYTFYAEWHNLNTSFTFSPTWSYPGQSSTTIPSSNLYLPTLVGSSPYTIFIKIYLLKTDTANKNITILNTTIDQLW